MIPHHDPDLKGDDEWGLGPGFECGLGAAGAVYLLVRMLCG